MRELNINEIQDVNGGVIPILVAQLDGGQQDLHSVQ